MHSFVSYNEMIIKRKRRIKDSFCHWIHAVPFKNTLWMEINLQSHTFIALYFYFLFHLRILYWSTFFFNEFRGVFANVSKKIISTFSHTIRYIVVCVFMEFLIKFQEINKSDYLIATAKRIMNEAPKIFTHLYGGHWRLTSSVRDI